MDECGIRSPLSDWFRAYLLDRMLQTLIEGQTGKKFSVIYDVLTGSVYGLIGYSMHVDSMCNVVKYYKVYMYADDTCLVYADNNLKNIEYKI